jgi:hypothetical protein
MKHDMSGHLLKYVEGTDGKPGKYQYEHDLIMEKKLGRKLRPNEIVHHIDGDPNNNSVSNLKVMTRGEHNKEDADHHKGGRTKGSKNGVRKDTYNKDKTKTERYDT